jgi:hypothetical protein
MPAYDPPRSDMSRAAFLRRAIESAHNDKEVLSSPPVVSDDTIAAAEAFLPQFTAAVDAVTATLGARSKETAEGVAALDRVKTYSRDLMEVVKRRVYRLGQPASVLEFYQMGLDGSVPNPGTQDEWLTLAERIVAGDAQAVAAGYPAMANPSAAELQAVLASARQEAVEADTADRVYDQAQEAAAALRLQADALIGDIVDEIRFATRKKDAPSQRRILRAYGAQFRYLPGETPEEEPAPAAA